MKFCQKQPLHMTMTLILLIRGILVWNDVLEVHSQKDTSWNAILEPIFFTKIPLMLIKASSDLLWEQCTYRLCVVSCQLVGGKPHTCIIWVMDNGPVSGSSSTET
jgi:cytochrome c oxidase assembly factor CtaG